MSVMLAITSGRDRGPRIPFGEEKGTLVVLKKGTLPPLPLGGLCSNVATWRQRTGRAE